MKNLFKTIIISSMLMGFNVKAEEAPDYLKDAEIVVRLKNGKEYKFSANDHKVVKRGVKASKTSKVTKSSENKKEAPKKNRVYIQSGFGPNDLKYKVYSNHTTVKHDSDFLYGVSYSRDVGNFSLMGSIYSNSMVTFGLGVGF
jgi:hypothetical protein